MIEALAALVFDEPDRLVLAGAFDIPIVANTELHTGCLDDPVFSNQREANPAVACVRYRFEDDVDDPDFDGQYVIALSNVGWRFAGGAANAYHFERMSNETC